MTDRDAAVENLAFHNAAREIQAVLPDVPVDENAILAAVSARMEAEALAQSGPVPNRQCCQPGPVMDGFHSIQPMPYQAISPVPIADLQARLDACVRAGVLKYRDGGLELTFDRSVRREAGVSTDKPGEVVSF